MNKKIDSEEICKVFNTLRQENLNKIFTPDEMKELLAANGIGNAAFRRMAQLGFFRSRQTPGRGNSKEYAFMATPIYKAQFERVYQDIRDRNNKKPIEKTQIITEDKAIAYLKNLGYQIKKPTGFDLNRFKLENQELYLKYCIY